MFHMEIIQERLEREYDLDIVITAPSVEYEVLKHDGEVRADRFACRLCLKRVILMKSENRG